MKSPDSFFRSKWYFATGIVILFLLMLSITLFYAPRTWGTLIDEQFSETKKSHVFTVQLGLDEEWHIKTWTNTQGTKYNITLIGHPIRYDQQIVRSTSLLYNWTVELGYDGSWVGYDFNFKIPWSVYGNEWHFELLLDGAGNLHLSITKFDQWNFMMFLLPDITLTIGIVAISIKYFYRKRARAS